MEKVTKRNTYLGQWSGRQRPQTAMDAPRTWNLGTQSAFNLPCAFMEGAHGKSSRLGGSSNEVAALELH
jgi:hypothetical protein